MHQSPASARGASRRGGCQQPSRAHKGTRSAPDGGAEHRGRGGALAAGAQSPHATARARTCVGPSSAASALCCLCRPLRLPLPWRAPSSMPSARGHLPPREAPSSQKEASDAPGAASAGSENSARLLAGAKRTGSSAHSGTSSRRFPPPGGILDAPQIGTASGVCALLPSWRVIAGTFVAPQRLAGCLTTPAAPPAPPRLLPGAAIVAHSRLSFVRIARPLHGGLWNATRSPCHRFPPGEARPAQVKAVQVLRHAARGAAVARVARVHSLRARPPHQHRTHAPPPAAAPCRPRRPTPCKPRQQP